MDLEAVDDFSFALAVVPLGFKALVFDSILAATAPVTVGVGVATFYLTFTGLSRGGICRVPRFTMK